MFTALRTTMGRVRLAAALTAAAFLVSGLFTLAMMNHRMGTSDCSLGGGAAPTCMADSGTHLAWWNATFVGIPAGAQSLAIVFLVAAAAFLSLAAFDGLLRHRAPVGIAHAPPGRPRDYFSLFLAAGKAQPLLYA